MVPKVTEMTHLEKMQGSLNNKIEQNEAKYLIQLKEAKYYFTYTCFKHVTLILSMTLNNTHI